MNGDDDPSRTRPTDDPESASASASETDAADAERRWSTAKTILTALANVALGTLVVAASAWALLFGRPGLQVWYLVFLALGVPFLLGYRGTTVSPRVVPGIAVFGAGLLLQDGPVLGVAADLAARLTGMDPVSARFAVEFGVDNALAIAWLQATLWVWLLAPGARGLVRHPPAPLSAFERVTGASCRGVVVSAAVALAVGTLSLAFLSGYYPVTTVSSPGGTYEHADVAVTVTDVQRFDADTEVALYPKVAGRPSEPSGEGAFVLVHLRARDQGHDDDVLIADARLVTRDDENGGRVTGRVDTVELPSGNPLFEGTESTATRIRVNGRNYSVYDPEERTGRTNEGWVLFRRPPGAGDAASYVRIQTESPGPAGKWPL